MVIKQDNGNYSIWSTIVDNFIKEDLTLKDLYNFYEREAIEASKVRVEELLNKAGKYKFAPNSIEEAKEYIKNNTLEE